MAPPDPLVWLGRFLLIAGGAMAFVGLLLVFGPRLPYLGRLPGDIVVDRGSFRLYIPITTCLLISLAITVLFAVVSHFRR
ncbi:MAG: DUF2905 domain-containing protein [Acidobacteriota bacterium]